MPRALCIITETLSIWRPVAKSFPGCFLNWTSAAVSFPGIVIGVEELAEWTIVRPAVLSCSSNNRLPLGDTALEGFQGLRFHLRPRLDSTSTAISTSLRIASVRCGMTGCCRRQSSITARNSSLNRIWTGRARVTPRGRPGRLFSVLAIFVLTVIIQVR